MPTMCSLLAQLKTSLTSVMPTDQAICQERERKYRGRGREKEKKRQEEKQRRERKGGERARESLRSSRLLTALLVLTQKHTALPDLSKARNMKCNFSLKFNSPRMKRKCFAEL